MSVDNYMHDCSSTCSFVRLHQKQLATESFSTFFVQQWAPAVNTIHQAKGGIVVSFLEEVLKAVKDLPVHEVL